MEWDCIRQVKVDAVTVQEHLIWDEYLLKACDDGKLGPLLRIWSAEQPAIVLGYSNHPVHEVLMESCKELDIPILRRTSGGGAVLLDSGCLNYSLILPVSFHSCLASVGQTNRYIMESHRGVLQELMGRGVTLQGHTDLVVGDRKVSGNAQRRLREAVLFHGSFLCHADLALMGQVLAFPSREPDYRNGRSHHQFVGNLGLPISVLKNALVSFWGGELDAELTVTREPGTWEESRKRIQINLPSL